MVGRPLKSVSIIGWVLVMYLEDIPVDLPVLPCGVP